MTTSATSQPGGVALLAALTPMLGLPITLALDAWTLGGAGGLVQGFLEGGWVMPLILLAGGAVSVIVGALLFFGVQRGAWGIFAIAPLASLTALVGTAGFVQAQKQVLEALAVMNVDDLATILAGGSAELLQLTILGLSATAGLLIATSVGCLLGAVARQTAKARRVLVAATVTLLALGAVYAAALARPTRVVAGFKALAELTPDERVGFLVALSKELESASGPMLAGLGLVAAATAAGLVVLRRDGAPAFLVALCTAGGLVGIGGHVLGQRLVEASSATVAAGLPPLGLIELDGSQASAPSECLTGEVVDDCAGRAPLPEELRARLARQVELARALGDDDDVRVQTGVRPNATAAALTRYLELAAVTGVRAVDLVGEIERPVPRLAAEFGALGSVLMSRQRSVRVWLEPRSRTCAAGCDFAVIVPAGLKVGEVVLSPLRPELVKPSPQQVVRVDAGRPIEPTAVVRAALAAAAGERRLTLVVGPVEAPVERLTQELIRSVMMRESDGIRWCYEDVLRRENPKLRGRIEVTFTILATGAVSGLKVEQDSLGSPTVTRCLVDRVKALRFPPGDREPVDVRYPWVFTPAG